MTLDAPRRDGPRRPWLLALDTATSTVIVAAGEPDGTPIAVETFAAGHRHSEHLLPALERLVRAAGLELAQLAGVIGGTGPGAFTGLRVGLATAKTLAHQLGKPIVAVSTAEALLDAASSAAGTDAGSDGRRSRLWLPAGPHDRLAIEPGGHPRREDDLPDDTGPWLDIAVDLPGRAAEDALGRGRAAVDGLPASLLRLGAARLARDETVAPDRLVPEYVTPPRGMDARLDLEAGMAWSRDHR